jgi:hypothetical protein
MTNDLVDDNAGIIQNYKVELNYIYVYYLDGHMERYDFSLATLHEINERMINQALYMVKYNTSEKVKKSKNADSWKLATTTGVMMLVASLFYNKYLIESGNFQMINLAFEGAAVLAMPLITKGYIDFINKDKYKNVEKYRMYLDHYYDFSKHSEDDALYQGIEYKGTISLNNIDGYSLKDVSTMCTNLTRIRNLNNY